MSDMSIKNKLDYTHIAAQAMKAYDMIAKLTFETYSYDKKGFDLVRDACTSIAALYNYTKQKEEENGKETIL